MLKRIALFGLGEAGSLFAVDFIAAGIEVSAYDPAPVGTPQGVTRTPAPDEAVQAADLVIALTAGSDAMTALTQALNEIPKSALYADLSTASAGTKKTLARTANEAGLLFTDVALMGVVPGRGLYTPALASGSGAARYVELLEVLNVPVARVSDAPGDAATRKLLRSVMMKGLAALVIESMAAAEREGLSSWLWENLVNEIAAADKALLARLVRGSKTHAKRRLQEMEASAELLADLGQDPVMTRATVETLRRVLEEGIPEIPEKG